MVKQWNHRISINWRASVRDGVGLTMTCLSLSIRPIRVRASNAIIACIHTQVQGQPLPAALSDGEVIDNKPEVSWFVKVVCSLYVHPRYLDSCSCYLDQYLTPAIALEVTRRLSIDPKSAFGFFQFARVNLGIAHFAEAYAILMRSLCKMGLHDSAKKVFDCLRSDGQLVDCWTMEVLFSSLAGAGEIALLKQLLVEVEREGFKIATNMYNKILHLLVRRNQVDEAIAFFREHLTVHSSPDTWTFNILISGLCRTRQVKRAFELFTEMKVFNSSADIITYNSLINGFCRIDDIDRGHSLLKEVRLRPDVSPNVVTYTSLISGCCRLGRMDKASALFHEMISLGVKPSTITFNVLIDGFGKVGNMETSLAMFEKMSRFSCLPDVVTFTSLMDGCCRAGQVEKGLKLWHEMNAWNISPNVYSFSVIINALCKDNRLNDAREFLRRLRWSKIVPKPFIYNPVVDGFCKAGNVDEANAILSEMEEECKPDKLTYTILIIGHCMKGRIVEALSIYYKMVAVGCTPDDITVNSFVSCLLKAGMAKEAFHIRQTALSDLNLGLSSTVDTPVRMNRGAEVAV